MKDGLTNADFVKQMNRLSAVWKDINSGERVTRYYRKVAGLPPEAIKFIVDTWLDSSQKMPLPNDFEKLAKEWRTNYFHEKGHYYGFDSAGSAVEAIQCGLCNDCGIIKIVHHNPDDFKQLMRCDCDAGTRSAALLPQWAGDIAGAFKRETMDPKWFNPTLLNGEPLEKSEMKFYKKLMDWKRILNKSEDYWRGVGYGMEEGK